MFSIPIVFIELIMHVYCHKLNNHQQCLTIITTSCAVLRTYVVFICFHFLTQSTYFYIWGGKMGRNVFRIHQLEILALCCFSFRGASDMAKSLAQTTSTRKPETIRIRLSAGSKLRQLDAAGTLNFTQRAAAAVWRGMTARWSRYVSYTKWTSEKWGDTGNRKGRMTN